MAVQKLKQRRGGDREMDKPLNLIPFISFLSVVVTFLVAGAAWATITQVETALPSPGQGKANTDPAGELTLSVVVSEDGYQIAGSGGALSPIPLLEQPKHGTLFDLETLDSKLAEIKEIFPEQKSVILAIQSQITYDDIVRTMNVCLKHDLQGISLAPYTSPKEMRARLGR